MPHDANGTELAVGTLVLVPCYIKAIHLTEDYCNVDVETLFRMPPADTRQRWTLNSKQTVVKPNGFRLAQPHFGRDGETRDTEPKDLGVPGLRSEGEV